METFVLGLHVPAKAMNLASPRRTVLFLCKLSLSILGIGDIVQLGFWNHAQSHRHVHGRGITVAKQVMPSSCP
eukprot:644245-Amphidinium_carterae.1